MSKIEWTEKTWNPMHGCTKCSPGCDNCYAERMANRQKHMGTKGYENGFAVTLRLDRLDQPLKNKKPTCYFVCSMGDLFHKDVPEAFIDRVHAVAALCSHHTFLFLTKNAKRMAEYWGYEYRWSMIEGSSQVIHEERTGEDASLWLAVHELPNIVNMITVCNQKEADEKIPDLLTVSGRRGLSIEPMLGAIDLTERLLCFGHECTGGCHCDIPYRKGPQCPEGIHQVILGGESGPGARPMNPQWVRGVRDQCEAAGVPFMFKQWGEWVPVGLLDVQPASDTYVDIDGATVSAGDFKQGIGAEACRVARVGKKKAGRTFDGRLHDELIWDKEVV